MKFFERKKKPAVFLVHGFGKNRSREFDPLVLFLEKHGYRTIRFDIYSLTDGQDADAKTWLARCEEQLKAAIAQYGNVAVVGFSMGGVIASYLASIYPVSRLVLVAPAFRYLDLEKVAGAVASKVKPEKGPKIPSSAQTKAFREVVSLCRNSIAHVDCPILILHGTADETIDPDSSREAYRLIPHQNKRLLYLEGAKHKMLYDGAMEETAFELVLLFLEGRLV